MTLLQFLRQARQVHLQFLSGTLVEPPIYVLGNPSADLDSIISAIVYSYCANNRFPTTSPRPHVPILNLPNGPAGPELYRLRPEFVTALWLSTNCPSLRNDERFENSSESAGKLLREHIVTVADFAQSLREKSRASQLLADATLVDWNAMPDRAEDQPGWGSLAGLAEVSFRAMGCIDHHVDEDFMPRPDDLPDDQPMLIQPGPGSCSSLIVTEMEKRGFWSADADASTEVAQLAKLALAPVLIDTSNLKAKGKVTDVDVRAVEFLLQEVTSAGEGSWAWDVETFYEQILTAKKNSLDLLTLDEVLDRDYKDWTETSQPSGQKVKLGFCSSVKPIRWIVEKAGGPRKFVEAVHAFAQAEKNLDVVVVMTSFTSSNDKFARELFISTSTDDSVSVDGVKAFVAQTTSELDLVGWFALDGESVDLSEEQIQSTLSGDSGPWRRLWVQKNTKPSRKQVAPLLRSAVAKL